MQNKKDKKQYKFSDPKETAEKQNAGFGPRCIKLGKDIHQFRLKEEKTVRMDVVPFVTKKGNPLVPEGEIHWERTFYVHSRIGAESQDYCCLLKNWGKPCPVCEHNKDLSVKGQSKEAKAYFWKKKQLIAILDHNDKDKGTQVYYGPYHFGLGQLIDNKMGKVKYKKFFYPEEGMMLEVVFKKEAFKNEADGSSGTFLKPVDLEFEDRAKQYDTEKMLEEMSICLDDLLVEVPYNKLKEILLQGGESENDEKAESPADKPARKDREEEDEEEEDDDEGDSDSEDDEEASKSLFRKGRFVTYKKKEWEIKRVSPDGTSLILEDEEGETIRGIDPDVCKPVKQKGDEEKLTPKPSKNGKNSKKDSDNDEWDSDESEEEEEVPVKKKK